MLYDQQYYKDAGFIMIFVVVMACAYLAVEWQFRDKDDG